MRVTLLHGLLPIRARAGGDAGTSCVQDQREPIVNPILRHRLKQFVHRAGIRTRSYTPQRRTMGESMRNLARLGFCPRTLIDVGAAHGTYDLYDPFPASHLLLIEPMQEFASALEVACGAYKGEYVIAAAGAERGHIEIRFGSDLTDSSLVVSSAETAPLKSRSVDMLRVDTLVQERNLEGPYLLKIDVQGSEMDVIAGAKDILAQTEVIILETSLYRLGKKRPVFAEVVCDLDALGYSVYDMFDGVNRPLDGALAQLDVAFVKTEGLFRRDDRWSTPEQQHAVDNQLIQRLRPLIGI